MGSNPAGNYLGTDGVTRYVKFYDDPVQSCCELLTSRIYAELGIDTPNSQLFEHHGKLAHASIWRDDLIGDFSDKKLPKEYSQEFLRGFHADVLTANWDVIGLLRENVAVTRTGGVMRLDNGSGLLMRAQGGKKPAALLNRIGEIDSYFTELNWSYSMEAEAAGYTSHADVPNLKRCWNSPCFMCTKSGMDEWTNMMNAHLPDFSKTHPDEFQAVVERLETRTEALKALVQQEDQV
ncbi:MAG: hypothetical protein ACRYGK_16135 [Janthinobacterium lividum]